MREVLQKCETVVCLFIMIIVMQPTTSLFLIISKGELSQVKEVQL